MNSADRRPSGAALLMALALGAGRLAGQQPADVQWSLEGGHGSYCIWYLADPELARQMVPGGTELTPAGDGAGLAPLLARTVQDEPRFSQWIPGAICISSYDRVTSAGRVLAQSKPNRPVIVATSSLAVKGARGFPTATRYLIDFMTDQRSLARAADGIGVGMSGITVITRTRVGADEPEVLIDVDGVRITWSGHAIGEPSVGKTRSVSFGYASGRVSGWMIDEESTPATARLMAGTLEVDGRNTLARALKASPGRAMGPEESGGTVVLSFHPGTRK